MALKNIEYSENDQLSSLENMRMWYTLKAEESRSVIQARPLHLVFQMYVYKETEHLVRF